MLQVSRSVSSAAADGDWRTAPEAAPAEPVPNPSRGSPFRPDRAHLSVLLPALALFLGALSLFAPSQALAQATTVWSGTLTVAPTLEGVGCHNDITATAARRCSSTSALSDDDFTYEGVSYGIVAVEIITQTNVLAVTIDRNPPPYFRENAILHVGSRQFRLSHARRASSGSRLAFHWSNPGLSWSVGDTVSLSLTAPPLPEASATVTLSLSQRSVFAGEQVKVTATLSKALSGWVAVRLGDASRNDEAGTAFKGRWRLPSSVFIAAGSTSGTGTIHTVGRDGQQHYGFRKVHISEITRQPSAGAVVKGDPFLETLHILQPPPVRNLKAAPGNRTLSVAWQAPSSGTPRGYDVHYTSRLDRGLADDAQPLTTGTDPTQGWAKAYEGLATSHVLTGLTNGRAYRVRVRPHFGLASDTGANRDKGKWTVIRVAPQRETAPTGLQVTPGDRQLTLRWKAPAPRGAGDSVYVYGYEVGYKCGDGGWTNHGETLTGNSRTFSDPVSRQTTRVIDGLAPGHAHDVRVRASYFLFRAVGGTTHRVRATGSTGRARPAAARRPRAPIVTTRAARPGSRPGHRIRGRCRVPAPPTGTRWARPGSIRTRR